MKSKKRILIALGVVAAMAAGAAAMWFYLTRSVEPANTIAIADIPNETTSSQVSDMAYISGRSDVSVSENQPNIYLVNDEANEEKGYTLQYDVYINGQKVHKSSVIKPGDAEPLNVYTNEVLHDGANDLKYKITVFHKNEIVAASNVDGLVIHKQ